MKPSAGKRILTAVVIVVASLTILAGCIGGKRNLNIATGGTSGTYYPIGTAIADILNKEVSGLKVSVQSTGATMANIHMLQDGSADLAIGQSDIIYYAANGLEMYQDENIAHLKGIASLYPEACQFVTLESSGIKSIADLRGKRVAVGSLGSGTEVNVRQILSAYGLTYDDISVQYLSFATAAKALRDRDIDASVQTAGYPTAAVQEMATHDKIRILPIGDKEADAIIAQYPFFTKITIPAGTYPGLDEDIPTLSIMALLVASEKIDDSLGEKIAEAIFSHPDKLKSAHGISQFISKDSALKGMPIEMNKGAKKFLEK